MDWPSHVIVIVIDAVAVAVNLASVPLGQGSFPLEPGIHHRTGAHAHQQQPERCKGKVVLCPRSGRSTALKAGP